MSNQTDDLGRKIAEARDNQNKAEQERRRIASPKSMSAGAQAGLEFVFCIGLATFIGYQLDQWLKTQPLWLILLFFIGVAAGFWCLYKYANNLGSAVGQASGHSVLPEAQKDANKAPENAPGIKSGANTKEDL